VVPIADVVPITNSTAKSHHPSERFENPDRVPLPSVMFVNVGVYVCVGSAKITQPVPSYRVSWRGVVRKAIIGATGTVSTASRAAAVANFIVVCSSRSTASDENAVGPFAVSPRFGIG